MNQKKTTFRLKIGRKLLNLIHDEAEKEFREPSAQIEYMLMKLITADKEMYNRYIGIVLPEKPIKKEIEKPKEIMEEIATTPLEEPSNKIHVDVNMVRKPYKNGNGWNYETVETFGNEEELKKWNGNK